MAIVSLCKFDCRGLWESGSGDGLERNTSVTNCYANEMHRRNTKCWQGVVCISLLVIAATLNLSVGLHGQLPILKIRRFVPPRQNPLYYHPSLSCQPYALS